MKTSCFTVLLIEDHPIIISAYKQALNAFTNQNPNITFSIDVAENCDVALKKINNFEKSKCKLKLIILDIRIPKSSNSKYLSGEDLGICIRERLPESKIIVSTSLNDNYRVHSIMHHVNPDAFLIKNDFTAKDIINAIKCVLNDEPFFSKSVLNYFRKQFTNDLLLDATDRNILYHLSIGIKTKELPKQIPLSLGGIEKRKRHLKQVFDVNSADDSELILKAKEKGFI
ncbi:response regulator [Aureivirga marina]|uniref:response regulator n=1 Tax=Aureivirga marina TaxID=1182451 RepID=UPI0018CA8A07|nr:response regulator [Aureivirga marina]